MTYPIRILELRSVWGVGGGPEKTILLGAARSDPARYAVTVCYLRDARDPAFTIDERAAKLGIDYVEVCERHSFDPRIWPALRRLVRARGIDIVHAHDYKTDFLAYLLAQVEDVIPLATVHGWSGRSRREQFYYAVDRRLLARFPRVIAVSGKLRDALRRVGMPPGRIDTIRNAIDHVAFRRDPARVAETRQRLGFGPGDVVIGSVGRLESEKQYELLLEAFARVRAGRPNVVLVLAGEGSERGLLEAAAQRLGLGSSCRLLGQWSDVVALHHALDLFVQSSDREGTPNAVLEAMAMETPVVATDVGGTAELVEQGVHGLLVPPGDPGALARAIDDALADPAGLARRRTAARRRIEEELSFDARQRALEAVYDRLMAGRRCSRRPA